MKGKKKEDISQPLPVSEAEVKTSRNKKKREGKKCRVTE